MFRFDGSEIHWVNDNLMCKYSISVLCSVLNCMLHQSRKNFDVVSLRPFAVFLQKCFELHLNHDIKAITWTVHCLMSQYVNIVGLWQRGFHLWIDCYNWPAQFCTTIFLQHFKLHWIELCQGVGIWLVCYRGGSLQYQLSNSFRIICQIVWELFVK